MTVLLVLSLLGLMWALAYHEAPLPLWLAALAAMLVAATLGMPPYLGLGLWLLAGATLVAFGIPGIRRRLISRPLLRRFRQVMPPISDTERAALEAGSVWWDAELFAGRPDWERLFELPSPRLSRREQAFVDGPTEQLCRMLDDWRITHEDRDLPAEIWSFIRGRRFFGLIIPREYGGLGFSALAHSQVVMKIASRSVTAAVTVMVPNSLGPGQLLLRYGTPAQRHHYLPRLARGEEIPCFALTGPEAGSDASALPDSGEVCYGAWQGRRVLGVRLDWDKRYITLAPVATLIGLAFRLRDPNRLLGRGQEPGITLALIPRTTPGVEIGRRHITLDIPFQNGPITGHGVFIPLEQIIGGRSGVGQGWRMLMESLAEGRGISLPALSVGAAKTASRYTGAYAAVRRQFNQPIGRFEGVQEGLARIAGLSYQMDAARLLTLQALDVGERPAVISAVVKYHLTERYRQVINDAMDIQGGSGICLGPANLLGRAYQAIPIAITVEGANILTRSMIIFGQGAMRCHPWILEELKAAQEADPRRRLERFDRAWRGHATYLLRNLARCLFLGLSRGRLSPSPVDGPLRPYLRRLDWMSAALALNADLGLMTLGGALKRKEHLSARLGDLFSELYLSSAVIKHFYDQGQPEADLPLLHWACEHSLQRMHRALHALWRNLPGPALGRILRVLTFPTGSGVSRDGPDDRLSDSVAGILLHPSRTRDRLTDGIFVSQDPHLRRGLLEAALRQTARVAPVESTLRAARRAGILSTRDTLALARVALAQGLIEREDYRELLAMHALRRRVIAVDAFPDYGHRPADTGTPQRIQESSHAA